MKTKAVPALKHASLIRRAIWRFQRLVGFKKRAWDEQFREGIWGTDLSSPKVLDKVVELCNGGRLVEFGCAFGQLPRNLPAGTFSSYLGMDISAYAIEEAERRLEKAGTENCRFMQADMASWDGDSEVSLIVMEECINYITGNALDAFLERCCDSLAPEGAILVVLHSAKKHWKPIEACREKCHTIQEETQDGRFFGTFTIRNGP